jgi:hypothetical protein
MDPYQIDTNLRQVSTTLELRLWSTTYNACYAQPTQKTNALPNAQIDVHGSGKENGAEGEQRTTEVVACEERCGVLWVGHRYVCWREISDMFVGMLIVTYRKRPGR